MRGGRVEAAGTDPAQITMLHARADFSAFLFRVSTHQPPARPIKKYRACLCGHTYPYPKKDV